LASAKNDIDLLVVDEGTVCWIPLLSIFRGLLLYLNFRGLSRVKDEFLKIPLIDKFLELLSEGLTVDCTVAHPSWKAQ